MKRKHNIERTRDEQGRFAREDKKVTDERGYVLVLCPDHPQKKHGNYVYEHRLIMEQHLGRFLRTSEVIHHLNGNPGDNRLENLKLFSSDSEHAIYEDRGNHIDYEKGIKMIKVKAAQRRSERGNPLISCACGCGTRFPKYDERGRPRRYARGHNGRWKND